MLGKANKGERLYGEAFIHRKAGVAPQQDIVPQKRRGHRSACVHDRLPGIRCRRCVGIFKRRGQAPETFEPGGNPCHRLSRVLRQGTGDCHRAHGSPIPGGGTERCSRDCRSNPQTQPAHRPPGVSPAQDPATSILPQPDPLLCQTGAPGAGQLRPYRSHQYRALYCCRRLSGAGRSIVEAVARAGDR